MTFKKYLKSCNKAQATAEYFILLCIVVVATIVAFGTFLNKIQTKTNEVYTKAYNRIEGADSGALAVTLDEITQRLHDLWGF